MRTRCQPKLPDGYSQKCVVDLQQDGKTAQKVAIASIVIFAVVLAIGFLCAPIHFLIGKGSEESSFFYFLLRIVVLILGYLSYIPLHELTHAVVMKCLGANKIQFSISKQFACAGSKDSYFSKKAHRCVALAPLLFWTLVLAVIACVVHPNWFWVVWLIEAYNVSGSIGDIYVTWFLSKTPDTVLINDTGFTITVYER